MGYKEPEMALTQARRRWTSGGKIIAILSVFGLLLSGCGKGSSPGAKTSQAAPVDPWLITNLDSSTETPALLWNGLIGFRTHAMTQEAAQAFDITEYQKSGEEKILPLTNPIDGYWTLTGSEKKLGSKELRDFKEVLSFRDGSIQRKWTWDTESGEVEVQQFVYLDPHKRRSAVQWTISAEQYTELTLHLPKLKLSNIQGGIGDVRVFNLHQGSSEYQIGAQVEGNNRRHDPAADEAATWQRDSALLGIERGKPLELWLVSQVGTEPDIIHVGVKKVGEQIKLEAKNDWKRFWQTDIEIDGPVEDQQFIRSALFYLRSSAHPDGKMSISPMGLSSDIYNGHVFWDADIWVFPVLALIDPERAKAIPAYRLKYLDQAQSNFYDWVVGGMPVGSGPALGKPITGHELARFDPIPAAKFPWESSVTGKETVPGPSKYQDHISGSIAWSVSQAESLGLIDAKSSQSLLEEVAGFFLARSTAGSGGLREIRGTMSPDEHHTGDNDLYTNLLAMWSMNDGQWPDQPTFKLPQATKQPSNQATPTFLTYDNDGLRGYKQAAAVLSIYPLQYPPAEKQARQMMERFADKVTKNGPAMTDSIHSIIWSRLGEKDKAYKTWYDSWKPFVKPPFLLFSEKRNSSRTYFTTGAAGSLQAVLYGFAGLRIDNKKAPNAQWSMPLKNGHILSIAPNLPKEWKKLTLRNLTVLGKKLTFEIESDKVKVIEGPQ